MNFDKESKSEEKKICSKGVGGGGGRGRRGEVGMEGRWVSERKKKCIHLLFVLMLYIKFQVPSSSGSLVLTQTK